MKGKPVPGAKMAVAALFLAVLLGAVAGCARLAEPTELVVGVIAYSGDANQKCCGDATLQAARLVAKGAAASGGVDLGGRKVPLRLVVEEVLSTPEEALAAVKRLVGVKGICAVIGPQHSSGAIAAGAVAEAAGIPLISPMATHPKVTEGRRLVFRIGTTDDQQAVALARFLKQDTGIRRVGALYHSGEPYSRQTAEVFARVFTESGGEVAMDAYPAGTTEFTSRLRRWSSRQLDALLLPNFPADVRRQGDQARALGMKAVFLGASGWNDPEIALDPAFEGSYKLGLWSIDYSGEANQRFVGAFREEYQIDPTTPAALTWDAFQVLFAAAGRAGGLEPKAIGEGIRSGPALEGASGRIQFREGGDPSKPVFIMRLAGGKEQFYRRFAPPDGLAP